MSLNSTARGGSGVSAKIGGLTYRRVEAKLPGEVSGDSIVFDLTIQNTTGRQLDLSSVVVVAIDSQGGPGSEIRTAPAKRMPTSVATGKSTTGTYVFVVAKSRLDPVTVLVTVTAERPVMVFKGDVK